MADLRLRQYVFGVLNLVESLITLASSATIHSALWYVRVKPGHML